MSLLELFCQVDDFCRTFVPEWRQLQLASGAIRRQRSKQLSLSEIMTILIWFHCSHYRTFKAYYCEQVQRHLQAEFPSLVSYSRFVEITPTALLPLLAYLRTCLGSCTGLSFLDATALAVAALIPTVTGYVWPAIDYQTQGQDEEPPAATGRQIAVAQTGHH